MGAFHIFQIAQMVPNRAKDLIYTYLRNLRRQRDAQSKHYVQADTW